MATERRRILIIKTGYTELLTNEKAGSPSLGDVLRATCMLSLFRGDEISWLVSKEAAPLLPAAPHIDEILIYSEATLSALLEREFDLIVNLERTEAIREFIDQLLCRSDPQVISFRVQEILPEVIDLPTGSNGNGHKTNVQREYYQHYLFLSLGHQWKGEPYSIPACANISEEPKYDVGFNHAVGSKWPVKAWPMSSWKELSKLCCKAGLTSSFQEGFSNLTQYVRWIQRHRIIVTSDSLGLHLALALRRRVVALFGPTRISDVHFYGLGEGIAVESPCSKAPCFQQICDFDSHCMETILPSKVLAVVEKQRVEGDKDSPANIGAAIPLEASK